MNENEIIEQNIKLVYYVVHKKFDGNEDYISIGMLGLIKGVRSFNANKGKLSTYLVSCIVHEIAYAYRQDKNPKNMISLDMNTNDDTTTLIDTFKSSEDVESELIKKEEKKLLFKSIKRLNKIEQYIIVNYYGLKGHKKRLLKDIAADLGFTPNSVTRIHTRALKKLKKYMEE